MMTWILKMLGLEYVQQFKQPTINSLPRHVWTQTTGNLQGAIVAYWTRDNLIAYPEEFVKHETEAGRVH